MPRILVVDDEEELRASLERVLLEAGHEVDAAGTVQQALTLLRRVTYELVISDVELPDRDGLDLLRNVRSLQPDAEVILVTAFADIPLAVDAIRQGAYDFLSKPFERAELELAVARALEKQALTVENRRLRTELADRGAGSPVRVIGQSPALQRVLQTVEQVAPSSATVLITGESGTGKEVVAELLHRLGPRRDRPLVKVNCSALPETLLEADLFGYERGAFTGAAGPKDGRFAAAHRGTLFLDEIGSVSPAVQVKLLRVLQDGTFEPLGSSRTARTDCRVVAATTADLATEVADGRFREDLFSRLNVITIVVPPLRDRAEDVLLLAGHFLRIYAAKNGKRIEGFSRPAADALAAHRWPGNIRELEHAVERAVVMCGGCTIDEDHLPDTVRRFDHAERGHGGTVPAITVEVGTPLEQVEQLLIKETLRTTGGNRQKAADLLGIAARTIYRKLGS